MGPMSGEQAPEDSCGPTIPLPGTDAERLAQQEYGTAERAERFYRDQLLDVLTPRMQDFIAAQTEMTLATAGADGRPDASVRFGDPGFVVVLDDRTLCWAELRGNGVLTSIGNLGKNPYAHLMFLDRDERIGLHLRGEAAVVPTEEMLRRHPHLPAPGRRKPECWVVLRLETSYIHCRKHFPRTDGQEVAWGTDSIRSKGGDYFGAKSTPSPWAP